jgi:hypothetical protein
MKFIGRFQIIVSFSGIDVWTEDDISDKTQKKHQKLSETLPPHTGNIAL